MTRVTFDIVDRCNLRCRSCYQGIYGGTNKVMSIETCEEILDHCTRHLDARVLDIFNWGEPLLCDQLEDFLRLFSKYKNLLVALSSNMNKTVPESTIEAILSRVHVVHFSISGIDQEIYEKYHRGGKINKVLGNLRTFLEMRRKTNSKTIFQWVFGINRYNKANAERISRFCSENNIVFCQQRYYVTPIQDVYKIYKGVEVDPAIYNLLYDSLDEVRNDILRSLTPNFCGLLRDVVTDCDGKVMTCCGGKITLDTHITEIRSIEELIKARLDNDFCKKCATIGLPGYFHLPPSKVGYHL